MNSLVFLLSKSIENSFLEVLRKPSKLMLWILAILGIFGLFILSAFTQKNADQFMDLIWLQGILFLFIMIFVVIGIQKGLSNGDVIFDMNDVNLLFGSPVNSRLILMYGIVRMAKMTFLSGFFILFQSNTLGTSFGIGFGGILLVLAGFFLAVSLLQTLSLLIYSLTNGRPSRKFKVRLISVLAFIPLVCYLALAYFRTGNPVSALENTLSSPWLSWTPIAGWASEGTVSFISGDLGNGFLFFGTLLLVELLVLLYIAFSNPDYYEDVLVATETSFERKRSLSEGQLNVTTISNKKVKVSGVGMRGLGANALFFKHLRESFRTNPFGLWGFSSILMVAGSAALSLFMGDGGGGLLVLLQILMWMQIFLIGTGRGLKELYTHYLYMIPDSSFRKIVWSNLESTFRVLVEGVMIFCVSGIVIGAPAGLVAASILVYSLFSFLLLGVNYVSLRWTGADISMGILMFLYTIAVILILLPGLISAVLIGNLLGDLGVYIGLAVLGAWEFVAGLGCFAFSKGILHRCDLPTVRQGSH